MKTFPSWLRKNFISSPNIQNLEDALNSSGVATVCRSAKCPNSNECFSKNELTFMILGTTCTRSCLFCSVAKGIPTGLEEKELFDIVNIIKLKRLRYVVVTSPTRDDLIDGGSSHFSRLIEMIKTETPGVCIEVLVPDFKGDEVSIKRVLAAGPDVFAHNIEMIPRFYPVVRPKSNYEVSLGVLRFAKLCGEILTKSSLILGFGEKEPEVVKVMEDLAGSGCDILVLGQYLKPLSEMYDVTEFVKPEKFGYFKKIALNMGFKAVLSEPFARTSYKAQEVFREAQTANIYDKAKAEA